MTIDQMNIEIIPGCPYSLHKYSLNGETVNIKLPVQIYLLFEQLSYLVRFLDQVTFVSFLLIIEAACV